MYIYTYIHIYAWLRNKCVCAGRTRIGSAKQLVAGGTGADGVWVEGNNVLKAVEVAAPRSGPVGTRRNNGPGLADGYSRVTAHVGVHDPRQSFRALIAARGTGV